MLNNLTEILSNYKEDHFVFFDWLDNFANNKSTKKLLMHVRKVLKKINVTLEYQKIPSHYLIHEGCEVSMTS